MAQRAPLIETPYTLEGKGHLAPLPKPNASAASRTLSIPGVDVVTKTTVPTLFDPGPRVHRMRLRGLLHFSRRKRGQPICGAPIETAEEKRVNRGDAGTCPVCWEDVLRTRAVLQ